MKREELAEFIEDKDIIDKVMKLHGADVEKTKAEIEGLKKSSKEKDDTINGLNEKIKSFDGSEDTIKELRGKVAEYEKAEKERIANEEKAKQESELKARFSKALGEKKFKHSDIENGRYQAFKDALANEENKGKGDVELFEEITKDLDCFENPQQSKLNLPPSGKGGNGAGADDDAIREIMGLPPLK